jgi:hypothetical protein
MRKQDLLEKFSVKKFILIFSISILALMGVGVSQTSNQSTISERDLAGSKTINGVKTDLKLDKKLGTNSVELWYQFLNFNPKSGSLSVNVYIWPSSDLAKMFSSSTITYVPISAFIDNLSPVTSFNFKSGDSIGAIPIELDGTNPLSLKNSDEMYYPFDQYSLDTYVKLKNGDLNSEVISDNSNSYEFFWPSQVPGFVFDVWRGATFADTYDWFDNEAYEEDKIAKQRENGEISVLIKVSRSNSVKFASILIYLGILLSCSALLIITIYVWRGKRPSSVTALVWAAAQILGLFQLRELLPDNPREGILLDLYIFYPGVIISLSCAVILSIIWVKKDNFQI